MSEVSGGMETELSQRMMDFANAVDKAHRKNEVDLDMAITYISAGFSLLAVMLEKIEQRLDEPPVDLMRFG